MDPSKSSPRLCGSTKVRGALITECHHRQVLSNPYRPPCLQRRPQLDSFGGFGLAFPFFLELSLLLVSKKLSWYGAFESAREPCGTGLATCSFRACCASTARNAPTPVLNEPLESAASQAVSFHRKRLPLGLPQREQLWSGCTVQDFPGRWLGAFDSQATFKA